MSSITEAEIREIEQLYHDAETDPHCEMPHEKMLLAIDGLAAELRALRAEIAELLEAAENTAAHWHAVPGGAVVTGPECPGCIAEDRLKTVLDAARRRWAEGGAR